MSFSCYYGGGHNDFLAKYSALRSLKHTADELFDRLRVESQESEGQVSLTEGIDHAVDQHPADRADCNNVLHKRSSELL